MHNSFPPFSLLVVSLLQPFQYMKDVGVGRKDWIPPLDHLSVFNGQSHSSYNFLPLPFECRQVECLLEFTLFITEQIIWEAQAFVNLLLILRILCRETVQLFHAQTLQLWVVVTERVSLWSAAAGARYVIPLRRNYFAWCAGSWIAEDDYKARELR